MSAEKVAHTPGPWRASPDSSIVGTAVLAKGGLVIASVLGERDAVRSNAALIAAAPDLLALAKRYASECAQCDGDGRILVTFNDREAEYDPCEACADIRAVIEKAEGRA